MQFPGIDGSIWRQADVPIDPDGATWSGSVDHSSTCGGACCTELIPHNIRYFVDIDATGAVTYSVSGSLPTSPHPNPQYCWCKEATLNCSFRGTVP